MAGRAHELLADVADELRDEVLVREDVLQREAHGRPRPLLLAAAGCCHRRAAASRGP